MEQGTATGMRIVVLDQHDDVRSGLVRRLQFDAGVSVAEGARNVAEATPIVKASRPHVVLFDPGGWRGAWRSELAALDALRDHDTPRFLIGLHVVRRTDPHACEARSLGADFIVLKGLRTKLLVELLVAELKRSHHAG